MNRSSNGNNGRTPGKRTWARRVHRWFGLAALAFVLLLSTTGIALNHTAGWHLDTTYVGWRWLLDAYGIGAPGPSASFAAGEHRATLLGGRLYVDGRELANGIETLAGMAASGELIAIATGSEVLFLAESGDLIERMNVRAALPAPIAGLGLVGGRVAVRSGNALFRFDENLLNLEPAALPEEAVRWSAPSAVPPEKLARLQDLYRGRGITVERLLADLHSGRLFTRFGPLLMDAAAVLLIGLSITGLLMWLRRK